ncbi:type I restriction enzyme S subunit [Frigoribacterium sp. PhB107]|uniref:hypothetical protein n=1 Tax=Frigoribacterium sp. PhB107 TaxID=2485172 RepID=UPI000FAA03A8|nr:hypothetical protein [Frigoribacterium sp. PhB107]ROP78858.1 type I restriction enzyme S subunit [Frigoribacterium sp. PhB107]
MHEAAPFWSLATLVSDSAESGDFQVALEDMVSQTGRLADGDLSTYGAKGTPFAEGDVLFGKLRPYLAKYWRADRAGTAGGDIHVYRPASDVDPRFLSYIVGSRDFVRFATAASKGVKMPRVEWMSLRGLAVHKPDLAAQRRIADYLDRETREIDAMIAKMDELTKQLESRRKTVVVSATHQAALALEGVEGATAPLPSGWRLLPLKFAVQDAQTGVWGDEPNGGVDDVRCARVADFDRNEIKVTEVPTIRRVPEKDRVKCSLERGDILVEKSGGTDRSPVGTIVAYEGETPAVYANFILRVRLTNEHDARFWLYALHGSYVGGRTWNYVRQTTGIQNLDVKGFMSMVHAVPSLDEQRRIAIQLDAVTLRIDTMLAKVAELRALLVERRTALITDVVTGDKEAP